jgi:hypothetical protein
MRCTLLLAIGIVALCACDGAARAADDGEAQAKYRHRHRPLEVTIYGARRRIGGYSYGASSTVNTYGSSPPPYANVRQSPGGPFDSGFFFDSGNSPRGGDSPYLH